MLLLTMMQDYRGKLNQLKASLVRHGDTNGFAAGDSQLFDSKLCEGPAAPAQPQRIERLEIMVKGLFAKLEQVS